MFNFAYSSSIIFLKLDSITFLLNVPLEVNSPLCSSKFLSMIINFTILSKGLRVLLTSETSVPK